MYYFAKGAKMLRKTVAMTLVVMGIIGFTGCGSSDSDGDTTGGATSDCENVTSDIFEATLWDKSCYIVKYDIDVDAELTVNAGTTVYFEADTGMRVDSGALIALGTPAIAAVIDINGTTVTEAKAAKPVLFTSKQKTIGFWDGLEFYGSVSDKNNLQNIIVEYADIGLNINNATRIKVNDSIFRNNETYGFIIDDAAIVDQFSRNISTSNNIAGKVYSTTLSALDYNSSFTGNTNNYIEMVSNDIKTPQTWKKLTVPVLLTGYEDVDKNLTIEAGSYFICDENSGIRVDDGSMKAIGTQNEPIIFTAKQKTKGFWKGIQFYSSNSINNELSFVNIEYAKTGLKLDSTNSRIKLNDVNLTNSETYGFDFNTKSYIDRFSNIVSTKNNIAGKIYANDLGALDSASDFTGNTNDYIQMMTQDVTTPQTWHALSVPTFIYDSSLDIETLVTIDAGANFISNYPNINLRVTSTGTLKAIGTATKPITFKGLENTKGYWEGILFYNTQNDNELAFVTIEDGGYGDAGAVAVNQSKANVHDCNIQNNGSYGIEVWPTNTTLTNVNNTFIDNNGADTYTH